MAFSGAPGTATLKSAQARYAAHAAALRGYAFRSLDGDDGYLFEIRDGARSAVFAAGAGTPYALNDARAASLARDKAFAAETLRQAGLPALPGQMFFVTRRGRDLRSPGREREDALAYAVSASYPMFCKPISASNGSYAEVVPDAAAFAGYIDRVSREYYAILVQPYVQAAEHRAFVLNGQVLFSYRKRLPSVIGDGARSVGALVEGLRRDPGAPTRVQDEAGRVLSLDVIPAPGARVILSGPANRAAGGSVEGLRDGASAPLSRLALAATESLGLRLAGVDVFDLPPAGDGAVLAVIEVNANPMIATLEEHDRWDLIAEIWCANIEAALK